MDKKVIWFKGEKVELLSTSEVFYGELFWNAIYKTGYKKDEPVLIADTFIRDYYPEIHVKLEAIK